MIRCTVQRSNRCTVRAQALKSLQDKMEKKGLKQVKAAIENSDKQLWLDIVAKDPELKN